MTAQNWLIQSQLTRLGVSEIVGQMAAPAHEYRNPTCTEPIGRLKKSAYRSRVYESDPREVEEARVGKLGPPDEATGPAIPPYIVGRAWRVGLSRVRSAAQNRRALDNPIRQAQTN